MLHEFEMIQPDDWHWHGRRGQMLRDLSIFMNYFGRLMVMGNTANSQGKPDPIDDAAKLIDYEQEVRQALPQGVEPKMTIMLTKKTTPESFEKAVEAGAFALKTIPDDTSTGSKGVGVSLVDLRSKFPVFEICQDKGIPTLWHWELFRDFETGKVLDPIFREEAAIEFLNLIVRNFPKLKIVVEHATTDAMIDYVWQAPKHLQIAATLTAHHQYITYDQVFNIRVINPWLYCLPIAKTKNDQIATRLAMVSGNPRFFYGGDLAPHYMEKKMSHNPPAGIYCGPTAIPLICQVFAEEGKLQNKNRIESFLSRSGAEFYELPLNRKKIVIKREKWISEKEHGSVKIFKGGEELDWRVELAA